LKLKCCIIEDDLFTGKILEKNISAFNNLELIDVYRDYTEAINGIIKHKIDLIFLDIELPSESGFTILDNIGFKPLVIIVSAKTEYALNAFDYDVIDFVKKPFQTERLTKAIEKAFIIFEQDRLNHKNGSQSTIMIKSGTKYIALPIQKILFIEAGADYVHIQLIDRRITALYTMRNLEQILPKDQFTRVHKSFIVNLNKISEYKNHELYINGYLIPVSRLQQKSIKNILLNRSSF
jgi:DNA-binding LytR/AlgR family response regulator